MRSSNVEVTVAKKGYGEGGGSQDARETTLALLAARASGATVCPSEVARALTAGDGGTAAPEWRNLMPLVHAAVDQMVIEGLVRLSWKGGMLTARTDPYRISRDERDRTR